MHYSYRLKTLLITILSLTLSLLFLSIPSCAYGEINCNKLQMLLNQFRKNNQITGMSLYIKSAKDSCYLFSGSIKRNSNKKITQNNLWQIGSITKSYFSAILLQFEAESETRKMPINFNINQKLKRWLPQYPNWGNVSIKQLLNMTSGIYNYTDLPISVMILNAPKKIWRLSEIADLAYQHQPNTYFAPGKDWHYSDTNYILIGQLIQKLYQKITDHKIPLRTILKQNIFDRLKLNNTYYYPQGLPKKLLSRMVHGYNYYTKKDFTSYNLSIAGPAGAMISTPKEVADWISALFANKVLPKKQLQEMISLVSQKTGEPIAANKTTFTPGYALGLTEQYSKKQGEVWLYQGVSSGYTAVYFYLPKHHIIISFAASIGSIKKNPITFSHFAEKVLKTLNLTLTQRGK